MNFITQPDNVSLIISIAIIGLIIGSFLNVVIIRLPQILHKQFRQAISDYIHSDIHIKFSPSLIFNLAYPHSHCVNCKQPLSILDNIPLISFLLLRGKCRYCKAKISIQYPVVECLGAIAPLMSWYVFGPSIEFIALSVLGWYLIALALIDIQHKLLPDNLTLSLLWLGLLINLENVFTDINSAVIGAASGYLIFFAIYWLFKIATGKEGLGQGDFKLLAAFGAWFGWHALLPIILISSLLGIAITLVLMAYNQIIFNKSISTLIPYGLYLALASWIYAFYGAELIAWYTSLILIN